MTASSPPFPGAAAFHAQQTAEKCLKAFPIHGEVLFPRTDDIGILLDLVSARDRALAEDLREAIRLTAYGVSMYYPGDLPQVTVQEALAALALADGAYRKVQAALLKCET